jgi:hypothetical protein
MPSSRAPLHKLSRTRYVSIALFEIAQPISQQGNNRLFNKGIFGTVIVHQFSSANVAPHAGITIVRKITHLYSLR